MQVQMHGDQRTLYEKAEAALKDIINSGTYKLNPSFCTNWDVDGGGWNSECIWALFLTRENYSWLVMLLLYLQ